MTQTPYEYSTGTGYPRTRTEWFDYPNATTRIDAAQLNQLDQAVADLKQAVFNVRDYGAKGDGTTDDTTAFNAATSAATAAGGLVYLPVGNYLISGVVRSGNRLVGNLRLGDGDTSLNHDAALGQILSLNKNYVTEVDQHWGAINFEATVIGTSPSGPSRTCFGVVTSIIDHPDVKNQTITGAANNGSGAIRLTVTGVAMGNGKPVAVYGVGGTTEANGYWIADYVDANHVDLRGSTFTHAYTSGGTITNRGSIYGAIFGIGPRVARGGLTGTAEFGDDVNGVAVFNNGTAKGTTAFLVNGNNGSLSGSAWGCGFCIEGDVDDGFRITGDVAGYGLDLNGSGIPSYGIGAILLPNNVPVYAANAAGNNIIEIFRLNTLDEVSVIQKSRFSGNIVFQEINVSLGTATGTKLGTATNEKLGFWNTTPVVQPSSTGTTTGFTAGAGTGVKDDSTFTGGVGSTAYRISDIVKHLKNMGLIAQ